MQADIADLRAVLGDDALLTIPALKDPANLRRYLRESDQSVASAKSYARLMPHSRLPA
ncbi:MAG TPA: hypothetical protein VFI11_10315 [Anaerolineales bacterium]|nr:hypothetical protein [Anaerolineales bacterium]